MCAFFPFHLALKAEPIQLCALCVCVYVCACTEARLCTVLVKRERERGDAGASRIPAGAGGCRPGCVNGARWVSGSHVCRLFDPLSGRAVTTGWPRCMGLGLLTHTPTGFDTHTHTHTHTISPETVIEHTLFVSAMYSEPIRSARCCCFFLPSAEPCKASTEKCYSSGPSPCALPFPAPLCCELASHTF